MPDFRDSVLFKLDLLDAEHVHNALRWAERESDFHSDRGVFKRLAGVLNYQIVQTRRLANARRGDSGPEFASLRPGPDAAEPGVQPPSVPGFPPHSDGHVA